MPYGEPKLAKSGGLAFAVFWVVDDRAVDTGCD